MRVKNAKIGAKVLVIKGCHCGKAGVIKGFLSITGDDWRIKKVASVKGNDNSNFCAPINCLVSDHTVKLDNHKRMKGYKHEKKG